MNDSRRIYVGLGANLGRPFHTFTQALQQMEEAGLFVLRLSPCYITAPVGGIPQPDYLNAVVELETVFSPTRVLKILQDTEKKFGRNRAAEVRWGPRPLDLDYLLDEDSPAQALPELILPHPRMWERAFVIHPLADLREDLHASDGESITHLAARLARTQPITGPLTEKEAAGHPR